MINVEKVVFVEAEDVSYAFEKNYLSDSRIIVNGKDGSYSFSVEKAAAHIVVLITVVLLFTMVVVAAYNLLVFISKIKVKKNTEDVSKPLK